MEGEGKEAPFCPAQSVGQSRKGERTDRGRYCFVVGWVGRRGKGETVTVTQLEIWHT